MTTKSKTNHRKKRVKSRKPSGRKTGRQTTRGEVVAFCRRYKNEIYPSTLQYRSEELQKVVSIRPGPRRAPKTLSVGIIIIVRTISVRARRSSGTTIIATTIRRYG